MPGFQVHIQSKMAYSVKQTQAEFQVAILQLHRENEILHTSSFTPLLMERNVTFQNQCF